MTAPNNTRIWLVLFDSADFDIGELGFLSSAPISVSNAPATPILKSLDGFSIAMGNYLPEFSGSIVLDNRPNSLGFGNRFSDYFSDQHRQTPINVTLKVYYAEAATNATDHYNTLTNATLTLYAELTTSGFSFNEETASINCKYSVVTDVPVTRTLPNITDFATAPSGSLSAYLPLIFGSAWTPLVPATSDYTWNGIATVRDDAPLYSASGYSVYDNLSTEWTYFNPCPSGTYSWNNQTLSGTPTATGLTQGYEVGYLLGRHSVSYTDDRDKATIITSVVLPIYFDVASPAGQINASIYRVPSNGTSSLLASGSAIFTDQYTGIGSHDIEIFFDKPVIHDGVTPHYLMISFPNITAFQLSIMLHNGSSVDIFYRTTSGGSTFYWGNSNPIEFKCYGISDTTYLSYDSWTAPGGTVGSLDADGNGVAMMKWTQRTAPTGQTQTSIAGLQIAVGVQGITDGAGGDITGTADMLLSESRHVLQYFRERFPNTGQKFSVEDPTTALTTIESARHVNINGAFRGAVFMRQAIEELCRTSGARINYKLLIEDAGAGYAKFFEDTKTVTAVITDDNASFITGVLIGQETITNRMRVLSNSIAAYKSNVSPVEAQSTFEWYYNKDYLTKAISQTSYDRYGHKYLGEEKFPLIWDYAGDPLKIAKKLAIRFALPSLLCQFEVPFSEFKTIRVLDLVEVLHSSVPYSFGGSTTTMNPSYNGTEVDLAKGRPWRRAKRYRAEVEAIELLYNANTTAKLRLTVRLITSPTDPT